jgi:hypothetical protein
MSYRLKKAAARLAITPDPAQSPWPAWSGLTGNNGAFWGGHRGSTPIPRNCLPTRVRFGSAPTRERFSARHQYLHEASIARLAKPWVRKSMAACLILR